MGYLKKRGRKPKDGPREPSGRLSRAKPAEDAALVVKFARIRKLGPQWFITHRMDPGDPMAGCDIGVAIVESTTPHGGDAAAWESALLARADLWNAANHIRACYERWRGVRGTPSPHAQGARILIPVDAMMADPDMPPPDLRTEAERASGAEAAWWNVNNRLFQFPPQWRSEVRRTIVNADTLNAKWEWVLPVLRDVADWLAGRVRAT